MRLDMAPKPADSTAGRHTDEAQAKVKAACESCRTRKIKVFTYPVLHHTRGDAKEREKELTV